MKTIARKLTFLNGDPYRVRCGKKLFYYLELIFHKKLSYELNNSSFNWIASEGIPFSIYNGTQNGSNVIRFQCVAPHGLTVGEYVELSFFYNQTNLFQVYSLGNNEKH